MSNKLVEFALLRRSVVCRVFIICSKSLPRVEWKNYKENLPA